jgi:hypothetical protein
MWKRKVLFQASLRRGSGEAAAYDKPVEPAARRGHGPTIGCLGEFRDDLLRLTWAVGQRSSELFAQLLGGSSRCDPALRESFQELGRVGRRVAQQQTRSGKRTVLRGSHGLLLSAPFCV